MLSQRNIIIKIYTHTHKFNITSYYLVTRISINAIYLFTAFNVFKIRKGFFYYLLKFLLNNKFCITLNHKS